jgi:His-Xaa-Ser system radical SAM maturase HxsC
MMTLNIRNYFLGRVTFKKEPWLKRKDCVFVTSERQSFRGYQGVLFLKNKYYPSFLCKTPVLYGLDKNDVDSLKEGDIILVDSQGNIKVLWYVESLHNCLLLTESCNCRCLMCPQPPKKHCNRYYQIARRILQLLDSSDVKEICLSGGEPTLFEDEFFDILRICQSKFPDSEVVLLTNGKKFSDFSFAKRMASIGLKKLLLCVSLHADVDDLHDEIVGVEGSFSQTIKGLVNLAKLGQQIEIRFVISKKNYKRMKMFSHFIFRNFPFVIHVAFMGLEIIGLAEKNYHEIWIDPKDFRDELAIAVLDLKRKSLNVSVYNVPYCLLDKRIWGFARQSISSWKNGFVSACEKCIQKDFCCGTFTTSGSLQSKNIKATQ